MAVILRVRKQGNALYLGFPMKMCKKENIKDGDYFEMEKDVLSPTYSLRKIGRDNGDVERNRN